MKKYYTRACNFFYGTQSKLLIKKRLSPTLWGKQISFNQIEVFIRDKKQVKSKVIHIKDIKKLPKTIKKKAIKDIKKIVAKRNFLSGKSHILMGILNMTPDSFSDGGKFNTFKKADQKIKNMRRAGADIIDIGGESTRPGSKTLNPKKELLRVRKIIEIFKKKFQRTLLSIDTRKSLLMDFSIKKGADIINDVSCFKFDKKSLKSIKNKKIWKIIHHMQGTPQTMQINPSYNHVLLDIYDFLKMKLKNSRMINLKKK